MLFLVVNSAGAVLIDLKFFSGKMTPWQWAGIALAVAAVCCIEVGRAKAHVETEQRVARTSQDASDGG